MGDSATFLASTSVLGTLFLINEYLLIIIITIQMENVNMEKVAEKKTKKHQNFTNRLQFTFTVTQRGGEHNAYAENCIFPKYKRH